MEGKEGKEGREGLNTVEVKIISWLGDIILNGQSGNLSLKIEEGSTIIDLLNKLVAEYESAHDALFSVRREPRIPTESCAPIEGQLHSYVRIIVNEKFMELLDGLGTELHNGDKVMLLPSYMGG